MFFSYRETITIDVIVTVEYNSQFIGIVQNQLARKLTAAKFLHISPIPALRYFVIGDDLNTNYTIMYYIWMKITYGHRGNTYHVSKLYTHKRDSPSYNISYHYVITVTIITLFDVKSPVKVNVDFETHLCFNVPSTSHSISVFSISIQGCSNISWKV